MATQKNLIQRHFTQRPESRSDFILVWVTICLAPFVAWPVIGWIVGSMSEGFARVVPSIIIVPIVSAVVLAFFYRRRQRESSVERTHE